MIALAPIALAFCHECLAWVDANSTYGSDGVVWNGEFKEHSKGFHFTDLNVVMEAVRWWCDTQGLTLAITAQRPPNMFRWRVQVAAHGYTLDNDLCHALMAACVAASRKLKGVG